MKLIGRLAFAIILPAFRLYLKKTQRAYVIIRVDGQILLSKNWIGRQKWQLPGGGIDKNESPEQAAIRELKEEAGINARASQLSKITEGIWQTDRLGYKYYIFGLELKNKPAIKQLYPEIIETAWLKLAELTPGNTTAEVLTALSSTGLL